MFKVKLTSKKGSFHKKCFYTTPDFKGTKYEIHWFEKEDYYKIKAPNFSVGYLASDYTHQDLVEATTPDYRGKISFYIINDDND